MLNGSGHGADELNMKALLTSETAAMLREMEFESEEQRIRRIRSAPRPVQGSSRSSRGGAAVEQEDYPGRWRRVVCLVPYRGRFH